MADQGFNHWKMTAIGLGLVVATGLVTGVVVASWSGRDAKPQPAVRVTARPASTPKVEAVAPAPAAVAAPVTVATAQASVPPQAAIDACNQHAASHTSQRSNTKEIVIDGAIGDGGSGAGRGAGIGAVLGGGGGALYGVNENRKNEARYPEIYASCMKSRGYGS